MRFVLAALAAFFVAVVGASGASQAVDLNALYQAASPGDTVVVPAGSYGAQSIGRDPDKPEGSAPVAFVAAPGAAVSFTTVELGTNRSLGPVSVELRGMRISVTRIVNAKDITLRGNDLGIVSVSAVERLRWFGGDAGPWSDGVVNLFGSCTGGPTACLTTDPSRDVLIDGVAFHDFTVSDPANHSECLQLGAVGGRNENVTIRNSTFRNCTDFDILVQGSLLNITVENNMLDAPIPGDRNTTACNPDCPRGGNAIRVDDRGGYDGIRIRYNTAVGGISVDPGGGSVLVRGNIGTRGAGGFFCSSQPGTQDHNLWATNQCSPTDVSVPSLAGVVVDADGRDGSLDLRLRDGSVAIDAGDPADFPAADIDGEARPAGVAPDIGADEHGATEPPPPPPPPPPPACPGDSLPLTVVASDATTVTYGWTPPGGVEDYVFYADEKRVSWSDDGNRSTVRFSKGAVCYRVDARGTVASGGASG